ncbi:hypothetical protein PG991_013468 [Apiospora marii]|uniref:Uncharacterized protein n=1 Tax=Apiospora marii TaxID=335849 RepID=A0ABR1R6V2_9PEZI
MAAYQIALHYRSRTTEDDEPAFGGAGIADAPPVPQPPLTQAGEPVVGLPQLPDVDGLLVTAQNPAREDLPGMDHARCAALHNYLMHYAWVAEGRPPAQLYDAGKTFFINARGWRAGALRPRIRPSLAAFLDTALLRPVNENWSKDHEGVGPESIFFWASGINEDPEQFFAKEDADLHDEEPDSLVCLYGFNEGGGPGGGVYYHQGCHRAAVFLDMWDHDNAMPVAAHPELWHPLETILSHWIELIRIGKVAAVPDRAPDPLLGKGDGLWRWRSYGEGQVATCVDAWDRLCDAIETRMLSSATAFEAAVWPSSAATPSSTVSTASSRTVAQEPLLTPSGLDVALVPERCFAREFLTRARRPKFQYIAPGLLLPPADERDFVASQPLTRLARESADAVPPVCLFPGAPRRAGDGDDEPRVVEVTMETANGFYYGCRDVLAEDPLSWIIPAGIYSEAVKRTEAVEDLAEEGFRLLLPYRLEGGENLSPGEQAEVDGAGARKSDGSPVGQGTVDELFQHGFKPFGGRCGRPQRLERLFEHWRTLVERGVWSVGAQGVEGTMDTFRDADTERWRDYQIPPTW